jgi:hypothetical protein
LVRAKHSLENDGVKIKNFNGNASPLHSPKNDDEKIKNCDGNASPLQDHKKTKRNKK